MPQKENFTTIYNRKPGPVVIYGTGPTSELVTAALKARQVPIACYCDGRVEMIGRQRHGCLIISPGELREKYHDAYVLVCLHREFWTVRDMLVADGMGKIYDAVDLIQEVDIHTSELAMLPAVLEDARKAYISLVCARGNSDKFFFPGAGFIVTSRCTLRCKLCLNMIPYLRERKDYPTRDIVRWIDNLLSGIDELGNLNLLGGEPFLYRELGEIIAAAAASPKVNRISITTNGTIMPPPGCLDALRKAGNAYVHISDYGKLSSKARELVDLLDANGVAHELDVITEWRNCGTMAGRGRSREEIEKVYRDCISKTCFTVVEGRLHCCGRSCFGSLTGEMPLFLEDCHDLDNSALTSEQRRQELRQLLFGRTYLRACDHCDGMGITMPVQKTAEQMNNDN